MKLLQVHSAVKTVPGEVLRAVTMTFDGEAKIFLLSTLPKKAEKAFEWRFFSLLTLITGLKSDRSLSKSYKLEVGGCNRETEQLYPSLFRDNFTTSESM